MYPALAKVQYGLEVPGRSTIGNINLDKRVPYFPTGLGDVVGLGGEQGWVKTEESATFPVDEKGLPIKGAIDVNTHKNWVNVPTVLHGTQRPETLEQDAMMNYMLTGKHLGKYDSGMDDAVNGARNIHIRQMNDQRGGLVSPQLQAEIDFAVENSYVDPAKNEALKPKGKK